MKSKYLKNAAFGLVIACVTVSVYGETANTANEIDLDCQDHSRQLIQQLSTAGLLVEGGAPRAEGISLDLCSKAQKAAQAQHEIAKKRAVENWFFQSTGGKPGNERLKKR